MAPKQEWAFFAAPPPRSLKILEVILEDHRTMHCFAYTNRITEELDDGIGRSSSFAKKIFDSLTPDKQPKETQFGKTIEIGAGMFVIYSENEGNGQFTFCVIANGTYMNQIQITAISDDPWILIKQKRFPSFPTDILMASMIATIWTAYSSLIRNQK